MPYTINRITELLDARRIGDKDTAIEWLLTDDKALLFPEETLFFAIRTKKDDGTASLRGLFARGVHNFVIEAKSIQGIAPTVNTSEFPGCNFLIVQNSLKALQKLGEAHRKQFNIPVVGITGGYGKTMIKEWLFQLLAPERNIVRSPHNDNPRMGATQTVWQMNDETGMAVFEAGISGAGEMSAVQSVLKPNIGILASVSTRQDKFLSVQDKCMEELYLFVDCEVVVYNGDNEIMKGCVSKSLLSIREIAWSRVDPNRPLFISSIKKSDSHTHITYQYLGMQNSFRIPFTDDASVENSINCLAVCLYLMLSSTEITRRMGLLEPVTMRMELKEGENNCMLIDDSYDLDIVSLETALGFLKYQSESKKLKSTVVLSDIINTGQPASVIYKKIAEMLRDNNVSRLIGVGGEISSSASRFGMESRFFPDTETLLNSDMPARTSHEIILVKGARAFGLERVADALECKVPDTILKVSLTALEKNLNYFRSKLQPGVKTMCMVKASAYGAGAIEVSKTLEEQQADYLTVAVVSEGIELRKAGITTPIVVVNPERSSFKTVAKYKLEPEIYGFHMLEDTIRDAEREGIINYPVHIKIDTGMHRLGFAPDEVPQLIGRLKKQNALVPRSVLSHLSGSDDAEFDDFTRLQIAVFREVTEKFREAFSHHIIRHISNSAAAERFPEAQFDMVRLGIGLYGINPTDNSIINHVSTLQTTIVQIRNVAAGETVGYSRRGKITTDSRIAILRIGYGEGVNRHLGNGNFYCLVNGRKAYYVGNICMDLCMIDVTGIDCKEGDRAILFGDGLPVTLMADKLGTISYEVLTNISCRVKRIYGKE